MKKISGYKANYAMINGKCSLCGKVLSTAIKEAVEEALKKVELVANDHYWNGLAKDKPLIMKHLKYILKFAYQQKLKNHKEVK